MPPFSTPPTPSWMRTDDHEIASAISDYLTVSRSPLRWDEPAWFDIAEQAEWERVCSAAGRPAGDHARGAAREAAGG